MPGRRKVADSGTQSRAITHDKAVDEGQQASLSNYFSSLLGERIANQTFFLNAASVTNSLLPNAPGAFSFHPESMAAPRNETTVSVSTIDTYSQEHSIHWIDILKTDTQGYDLCVFRGAETLLAESRVAVILTEVLFAHLYSGQAYFEDIYIHLLHRGFRLVGLYSVSWNSQHYASWGDALFVHPEAVARRRAKVVV